jgi:Fe-S-cluster containining protein
MITTPLRTVLRLGKECQRKNNCCKFGSGCLVGNDLKNIAKFLKIKEKQLKEKYLKEFERFHTTLWRPKLKKTQGKPYGQCIFFDNNGCSIHPVKPLECRIGNCGEHGEELSLWFMLNHFVNPNDPQSIREFATYLKCGGKTLPGGELNTLIPDKKKLNKILSYEVLK